MLAVLGECKPSCHPNATRQYPYFSFLCHSNPHHEPWFSVCIYCRATRHKTFWSFECLYWPSRLVRQWCHVPMGRESCYSVAHRSFVQNSLNDNERIWQPLLFQLHRKIKWGSSALLRITSVDKVMTIFRLFYDKHSDSSGTASKGIVQLIEQGPAVGLQCYMA